MSNSTRWINEIRGTDSMSEVSRRSGIPQPTLARQVNNDQLTFEVVREICRAYERPVIPALIELGHLTEVDAGVEGLERVLQTASDAQLVREMARRMDVTPSSMLWDVPVSEAVDRAEATVHHVEFTREPVDDPRAVASPRSEDDGSDEHYDD